MFMTCHCSLLRRCLDYRNGKAHFVTYMFNDSYNKMMSLLRDLVMKKVIREVKDAGMYGFLADTTPNLYRYDQLTIAICYMNETSLNERLLELKHLSTSINSKQYCYGVPRVDVRHFSVGQSIVRFCKRPCPEYITGGSRSYRRLSVTIYLICPA